MVCVNFSLPLPCSGLGGGGGAVCEAGMVWGEDSLHPQGRHQIPPPLRLDPWRGRQSGMVGGGERGSWCMVAAAGVSLQRGGIFVKRRGRDQGSYIR